MGFFVRKPLESWGMEKWNEQTKHAQESCRQAGTRPQVSHVSMPVPQLLPFLLILLLQWTLFLTQSFIIQVTVHLQEFPGCTAGWWGPDWGHTCDTGKLTSCPGGYWPLPSGVLCHYCLYCNLDKEPSWSPGTETGINTRRRADVLQRNRWKHTSLKSHRRINKSTHT